MPSTAPWLPAPLTLACSDDCRSPECLRQVLAQFEVEEDERYVRDSFGCPGTRCNIFVWDATRALECEIPHWVDACGHGVAPGSKGSRELSAAGQIEWLERCGPACGWRVVSQLEARTFANAGLPVVATWRSPAPERPSHVAMVLPTPDDVKQLRIAQAGAKNLFDAPMPQGFGILKVVFWTHK